MVSFTVVLLAPVIALAIWNAGKKQFEYQNPRLAVRSFVLGLLAVIPATVMAMAAQDLAFTSSNELFAVIQKAVLFGFVMAWSKYIFLSSQAYKKEVLNDPYMGIFYASLLSLGYLTGQGVVGLIKPGEDPSLVQGLLAIPVTLLISVVLGYYIGMSKFRLDLDDNRAVKYRMKALVFCTLLEGFFLFCQEIRDMQGLFYPMTIGFGVLTALVAVRLGVKALRMHQRGDFYRRKRHEGALL